jgi:hypothetical protein
MSVFRCGHGLHSDPTSVRIGDPTRAPAVDHSARDVHDAAQRHQPKHDLRAGQSLTLRSAMPPSLGVELLRQASHRLGIQLGELRRQLLVRVALSA